MDRYMIALFRTAWKMVRLGAFVSALFFLLCGNIFLTFLCIIIGCIRMPRYLRMY